MTTDIVPELGHLDRPAWAALSTRHLALSLGDALARRYARDVNLFASACDDSARALAALADLVQPGERIFILQVPAIVVPTAWCRSKRPRACRWSQRDKWRRHGGMKMKIS